MECFKDLAAVNLSNVLIFILSIIKNETKKNKSGITRSFSR